VLRWCERTLRGMAWHEDRPRATTGARRAQHRSRTYSECSTYSGFSMLAGTCELTGSRVLSSGLAALVIHSCIHSFVRSFVRSLRTKRLRVVRRPDDVLLRAVRVKHPRSLVPTCATGIVEQQIAPRRARLTCAPIRDDRCKPYMPSHTCKQHKPSHTCKLHKPRLRRPSAQIDRSIGL
jgi:hypothetical protein